MSGISPPVPYQWNVGDVGSAALLNAQLYTGLAFLLSPPMFEAVQATTKTTVNSGTSWTALNFSDTAGILADTYGGWSSSAPTKYVGQIPGWYWVSGGVCYQSNATGNRGVRIAKNGNGYSGGATIVGGAATSQDTAIPTPVRKVYLNGTTDYLEIHTLQTSGASLLTDITADVCSNFTVFFAHL